MRVSIATRSSRITGAYARRDRGFTLIEIVLGMAILGLIVSGIYAVAVGTVKLSNAVSESQNEEIRLHNFLRLLRRNFERMPGNAGITMLPINGNPPETDIVFYNYPLAYYWPSVPAGSSRVVLMSKKSSRGSLDVGLLYLDEEAPEDYRSSMGGISQQPGLWLNLLSDVMVFRWTFFDETLGDAGEWVELWEDPQKRPGIVRLELQFLGQGLDEKVESIFWIPNMINPEQLVQSNNQQGGGQGGGGGGGQVGQGGRRGGDGPPSGGGRGGAGGRGGGASPSGSGRGGGR
ncbi:MAG: prepilin-type N-terminal cleavage/methylation domain-containing protein [Verrucomicrobiales bacterium]|nr:prepilin-type N-terminal cleavage/methylation domain-containing protein [Verrucomicrobiales bacterium]